MLKIINIAISNICRSILWIKDIKIQTENKEVNGYTLNKLLIKSIIIISTVLYVLRYTLENL